MTYQLYGTRYLDMTFRVWDRKKRKYIEVHCKGKASVFLNSKSIEYLVQQAGRNKGKRAKYGAFKVVFHGVRREVAQ